MNQTYDGLDKKSIRTTLENRKFSYILECEYTDCMFDSVIFDFSTFEACVFNNCYFFNCSFDGCIFRKCSFWNLEVARSNFIESAFDSCYIRDSKINFCDARYIIFDNTSFEHVDTKYNYIDDSLIVDSGNGVNSKISFKEVTEW